MVNGDLLHSYYAYHVRVGSNRIMYPMPNKMLLLTTLAALALHPANAYQEYPTVIAVYNTTGESAIVNCSIGANYRYEINDLPLGNITSGTLLRLCSKSFVLR